MGKVLVEGSKVTCGAAPPHQGVLSMSGASRLVVDDRKVLTTESVTKAKLSTTVPCTNPGNSTAPCTGIDAATFSGGTSTRLRVDGVFVVLDSLKANTDKASPVHVDQTAINNTLLEAD
jgi:hypothetical protein